MIKSKTKGSEKMTGIGESDFRMLRQKQNYYIDKTEFIKNIIDNQIQDSKELFAGLKIMEAGEKDTSQMSSYPCIYMTFKDVRQTT